MNFVSLKYSDSEGEESKYIIDNYEFSRPTVGHYYMLGTENKENKHHSDTYDITYEITEEEFKEYDEKFKKSRLNGTVTSGEYILIKF